MSAETSAKLQAALRALSPVRIVFAALREWFAPHGPGRKITLAALYGFFALRMLPGLSGNAAAVEYLVMGLVLVFGGSTLTQGLVKDRMGNRPGPGEEPGPSPGARPPSPGATP